MRQLVTRLHALGWMAAGVLLCMQGVLEAQVPPPPAVAAPPAAAPNQAPAPGAAPNQAPAPVAAPNQAPPAAPNHPAKEPAEGDDKLITMDFQDVDLQVLVKFISEITGKNFIVDEKVRGKITIISPGKISVDEAYLVFQSVLQVKGFTTVPSGAVIKIVATKEAKTSTLDTVFPDVHPAPVDEYITRLMPLKYVDSNNMVAILQPLVSPDGLLAAYPATNTLIIIDTAAQTDRLGRILSQLDVEGFEQRIEVIHLNYAFAGDIAALLQQVLSEEGGGPTGAPVTQPGAAPDARVRRGAAPRAPGAPGAAAAGAIVGGATPEHAFKIIPDERTNSLILLAGPPEMRRIKDLIARLDTPLPLGTGRIHVYYLKYANALELSVVVSSLIGGGIGGIGGGNLINGALASGGLRGGLGGRGGGTFGGGGGFGGGGFGGGIGGGGGGFGRGSLGGGGFGQSGFGQGGFGGGGFGSQAGLGGFGGGLTRPGGGLGGGGGQAEEFEGRVAITADPATNSLIINASPRDFETLKEVIEKLDVRRRQVYIEAIIAEISLEKTRELGIELQGATALGNAGVGLGRTNFTGDITTLFSNPTSLQGIILAAVSNQTITVNGVTVPAQAALLRALETDNDTNILSAPAVLTTDNQQAEVVAGQNVPFIASRSTSEVNLANTFATIERRDVGITLRIVPQISEGGTVRMDIFEEVSDVISVDPNLGPTTTIRSATTTVVAKHGQTVVIGGLIFDNANKNENKVPFLGDIPFIGNFFRTDRVNNRKTNLLIFLTPHIIRNERDQARMSVEERQRKIFDALEESGWRPPPWRQLYTPSWEVRPSDQPEEEAPPEGAPPPAPKRSAPQPPPAELQEEMGTSEPPTEAAVRQPQFGNHYVLLAAVWESGIAPESLRSNNGLLALSVPGDGSLATFFTKGDTYRFRSGGYTATFRCLEVFGTPQEAFASYPEGMRVSGNPLTYLHWREPSEPASLRKANWGLVS
jgi:general secretion pathway protein D